MSCRALQGIEDEPSPARIPLARRQRPRGAERHRTRNRRRHDPDLPAHRLIPMEEVPRMNTATAFAQPPKRRHCSQQSRPNRRARTTSERPPNHAAVKPDERAPSTRMRIDFTPTASSMRHHHRDPDWTLEGGER
jgi:hypothetical protein